MHLCTPYHQRCWLLNWMLITRWKVSLLSRPEDTVCHGPAGVPRLATRCLCVLSTWLVVCLVPCAPMSIVCPLPSAGQTIDMGAHGTKQTTSHVLNTQRHLVASLGTPAGPWHGVRDFQQECQILTIEHFSTLKQSILNEPWPTGHNGASGPCSYGFLFAW